MRYAPSEERKGAERDFGAVAVLRAALLRLRGHRLGLEERPILLRLARHRRWRHLEFPGDLPEGRALFEHVLYLAPVVEAYVRSLLLGRGILFPGAGRRDCR